MYMEYELVLSNDKKNIQSLAALVTYLNHSFISIYTLEPIQISKASDYSKRY